MMKARVLLFVLSVFCFQDSKLVSAREAKGKHVLRVGIILRMKDHFTDTLSYTMDGLRAAKLVFERNHPQLQVQFKVYSHSESLQSVQEAANRAIEDKMTAVIGGELSEESFVLRDQLGEKKIVFITPTSSNPAVTEGHPYAFRICFSDRWVASELAKFTISVLKPKAIGLIHNVSSPYTDFQAKQYVETIRELNARTSLEQRTPVFEELILKDTLNFEPQIRKFIESGVTHVALLLHRSEFLRFVSQANELRFFPAYVGSDGWGSNEHIYRDLLANSSWKKKFVGYRSAYWNEKLQTSIAQQFKLEYYKLTQRSPNAWSAVGFDSAWVLFTAMHKAKTLSGEEIRKHLLEVKNLELVTHPRFSFGKDNSPHLTVPIFKLQGAGSQFEVLVR